MSYWNRQIPSWTSLLSLNVQQEMLFRKNKDWPLEQKAQWLRELLGGVSL